MAADRGTEQDCRMFAEVDMGRPAVDAGKVPLAWSGVRASKVLASEEGEGAMLVELEDGLVVVKMGGTDVAGEVAAAALARELGVYAPCVRAVKSAGEEGKELRSELGAVAGSFNPEIGEEVDLKRRYATYAVTKKAFALVCDFCQGRPVAEADGAALERIGAWEEVGRICAFDALINNRDRVPVVWDNAGNAGNMLFGAERVAAIDQQVSCRFAGGQDLLDAYIERVGAALRDPPVERVVDFFSSAGHEMSADEQVAWTSGFNAMTLIIGGDVARWKEVVRSVRAAVDAQFAGGAVDNTADVNVDALDRLLDAFAAAVVH